MLSYKDSLDEYLCILVNILSPLLYQGLVSIYDTAVNYKKKNNLDTDELRIFQDLLRSVIPHWNRNTIEQEYKRIKISSKYGESLDRLIITIIKCHTIILTCKPKISKDMEIFINEYDCEVFIHKSYIQCAREIFNNPFLFKGTTAKEIKENQKEILNLIKISIKIALTDSLPLNILLNDFEEQELNIVLEQNNNVEKKSDKSDEINIHDMRVNQKYLELKKPTLLEYKKNVTDNEIPLLNTDGENIINKVFSNMNIIENKPNLVDDMDVASLVQSDNKISDIYNKHTLTNFLKQEEVPNDVSEIKQSAIDEFEEVYDNNNN
jgi:hypothetical protein